MSKILNVNSGNYTIRVPSGNNIVLDSPNGTVDLTGSLNVQGTTTTVNSATLSIKDNIIVLNQGETGNGITLGKAGLRIERGNYADQLFEFDESITHNDPVTQTNEVGTWVLRDEAENPVLQTTITGGGDLYPVLGNGVVSVSGTNNYEVQVTDDDDIPNKKYVDDAIVTGIQTIPSKYC